MKRKMIFLLFFTVVSVGVYLYFRPFPAYSPSSNNTPSPTTSIDDSCIDHLGQPKEPGSCNAVTAEQRTCDTDSECIATCSYGCIGDNVLTNGSLVDCQAIPQYQCNCVQGVCRKK